MTPNLPLRAYLPFAVIFYKDQRRKDENDFEKDTVSGFQNNPELKN